MKWLCKVLGHSHPYWDSIYDNHLCARCGHDRTGGDFDRALKALEEWKIGEPPAKPKLRLVGKPSVNSNS